MSLEDVAQGRVNAGFSDAELTSSFSPEGAELLKRAPATQRENVMSEVFNRSVGVVVKPDNRTALEQRRPELEVLEEVLRENGW